MFDFFKRLFQNQAQANVPILREALQRSEAYEQAYYAWQFGKNKDYLMQYIQRQYNAFTQQQSVDATSIIFINKASLRGFIFKYQSLQASPQEFSFLFDYFKTVILDELHYKRYTSDVKNYARPKFVETIERHYLKPRLNFKAMSEGAKANQRYGNITIEQLLHNEQPIQIKLICSPYNDHKYQTPLSFQTFMEDLFT